MSSSHKKTRPTRRRHVRMQKPFREPPFRLFPRADVHRAFAPRQVAPRVHLAVVVKEHDDEIVEVERANDTVDESHLSNADGDGEEIRRGGAGIVRGGTPQATHSKIGRARANAGGEVPLGFELGTVAEWREGFASHVSRAASETAAAARRRRTSMTRQSRSMDASASARRSMRRAFSPVSARRRDWDSASRDVGAGAEEGKGDEREEKKEEVGADDREGVGGVVALRATPHTSAPATRPTRRAGSATRGRARRRSRWAGEDACVCRWGPRGASLRQRQAERPGGRATRRRPRPRWTARVRSAVHDARRDARADVRARRGAATTTD